MSTNAGPRSYLLRRARVTVVAVTDRQFLYDPTFDSLHTYMTNRPGYAADSDAGRPVEIYGAGFRNGFTAASFKGDSYYGPLNPISSGNIMIGARSVYAAMFGANGVLVDVSNNVGQANAAWTQPPFEVSPWAIGRTTNAAPGEFVPADSAFTFDIDLKDPLVAGYFQSALHEGRLRLVISSLSPAVQVTPGGTANGGSGSYPTWSTLQNLVYDAPRLELDGALISAEDSDHDGLPDDWERFYFGDLHAAASDDSDGDGMSNAAEFRAGTDPTNPASRLAITRSNFDADGNASLEFSIAPSRHG